MYNNQAYAKHGIEFEKNLLQLLNDRSNKALAKSAAVSVALSTHSVVSTPQMLLDILRVTDQVLVVPTKIDSTHNREDFELVCLDYRYGCVLHGSWHVKCPRDIQRQTKDICVGYRDGVYYFADGEGDRVTISCYDTTQPLAEVECFGIVEKAADEDMPDQFCKGSREAVIWAYKRFKLLVKPEATPRQPHLV